MSPSEFRTALLIEQFAHPVPEWYPTAKHRKAAWDRTRLVEDAMWREQQAVS